MNKSQLRNFVFTWNNYTADDEKVVEEYIKEHCKYGVFGREVGESGTAHLQGYAELKKRTRFNTVRNVMKCHIEKRRGTAKQASDYAKKDGDFFEHGEISNPGKRNDLLRLRDAAVANIPEEDIIDDDSLMPIYGRFSRLYDRMRQLKAPDRKEKTRLVIYYGPPGTGKSHRVLQESPKVYYKDLSTPVYWDGYDGQSDVVMEDFRGEVSLTQMLRICDKYPLQVQCKGSRVKFNARTLYITSNLHYHDWWNSTQKGYDISICAFERRIDVIEEMNEVYREY
jgi:hypothetical protein